MADKKISDMTALAAGSQATGDLVTVVDISETAVADKNKKMTMEDLFKGIPGRIGIGTTSPEQDIHINNATPAIILSDTDEANSQTLITAAGKTCQIIATGGTVDGRFTFSSRTSGGSVTERFRIENDGNVGIGTSTPGAGLEINTSVVGGVPTLYLNRSATQTTTSDIALVANAIIRSENSIKNVVNNGGIFSWSIGGTDSKAGTSGASEKMRIDSSGNFLIGHTTTSMATPLSVAVTAIANIGDNAGTTSTGLLRVHDKGATNNRFCGLEIRNRNSGDVRIMNVDHGTGNRASMAFLTDNGTTTPSERLRINYDGNVGIGTNSPQTLLDCQGSGSQTIRARTNDTSGTAVGILRAEYAGGGGGTNANVELRAGDGYSYLVNTTNSPLLFGVNTTERMRIDSSGRVGIGVSTMVGGAGDVTIIRSSALRWADSDGTQRADIYGDSSSNLVFRNGTGSTERMRINSSGNVGVGTTSPIARVTALGIASAGEGGTMCIQNTGTGVNTSVALYLTPNNGGGNDLQRSAAIKSRQEISGNYADLEFYTSASNTPTERMRIGNSGHVGIGKTGVDTHSFTRALDVSGPSGAALYLRTNGETAKTVVVGQYGVEGYFRNEATGGNIRFQVEATEKMRLTSNGNLGIGTTSVARGPVHVHRNSTSDCQVHLTNTDTGTTSSDGLTLFAKLANAGLWYRENGDFLIATNGSERMRIKNTGRVGILTSSPDSSLHVNGAITTNNNQGIYSLNPGGSNRRILSLGSDNNTYVNARGTSADSEELRFQTEATNRMAIAASGMVRVGNHTGRTNFFNNLAGALFQVEAAGTSNTDFTRFTSQTWGQNSGDGPIHIFAKHRSTATGGTTIVQNGDDIGQISFQGSDGSDFIQAAYVRAEVGGTPGANDMPGRLLFGTTADGGTVPTERMRINADGIININTTNNNPPANSVIGTAFRADGSINTATSGTKALAIGLNSSDGTLIEFRQAGSAEGTITVSGSTVSYNGGHLSRWSQLANGAERIEILRGSVLSNLDEMCEWGDEENEQLNRMKLSDTEGDRNVAGVFQAWDDDDDTYTNDFYCAMTGDFVIRIAQGVTVERGDLLMSAGDGTAKPQNDDIIRSKTIAKVTSNNVSVTYSDGSYCVPCVLMAC